MRTERNQEMHTEIKTGSSENYAIQAEHLSVNWDGFSISNLDFCVPEGSIVGLIGENGAGKTTLLRMILNLIREHEGTVSVLGEDNRSDAFYQKADQIGAVFDEAYFPENLEAMEIGKLMNMTYRNWDDKAYLRYLELLKIPVDTPFQNMSRGTKMKLQISCALSHGPRLLIMDEPTSGLDPVIREEILDIFFEFTRDPSHTVLMSSHIVEDLEKICDYISFMRGGKILFFEEKDVLLERYAVVQVTREELARLPGEEVISYKKCAYGAEALVHREWLMKNTDMQPEHASLERVVLLLTKGV